MSDNKVAEKVLGDVYDLGTDLLEALHRSSQRNRGRDAGPGSDLLYSFVKLQASQLNHLARLGLAQSEYARRAFESLYGGNDGAYSCDVEIEGAVGKQVSGAFKVKNPKASKAKLALRHSCFSQIGRNYQFNQAVTFGGKGKAKKPASVPTGESDLSIRFKLDPKLFMAGQSYHTVVTVLLDDEVRDTVGVLVKVL